MQNLIEQLEELASAPLTEAMKPTKIRAGTISRGDTVHGTLHSGGKITIWVDDVEKFGDRYKVSGTFSSGHVDNVKRRGSHSWVWSSTITKILK